jgi:hypothetical protein
MKVREKELSSSKIPDMPVSKSLFAMAFLDLINTVLFL